MIIMFVRHGESKKDKLSKFGVKQCKMMVKKEEKYKFSKIYSSPANRCVQTARFFQKKYKIKTEICENLRERELLPNSVPQNEKEQEWYDNYLNPLYSSENPEGCKEYLTRTFVEFKRMVDEHLEKDENIIIVAHSGTLYTLSAFVHGIVKGKNLVWMRLGNCDRIYYEINKKD